MATTKQSSIQMYLDQLQAAAGSLPTFDAARYRQQADESTEAAKNAIRMQGAALAYKLAELQQQRQASDAGSNAAIAQYGQQAQAAQQNVTQTGNADIAAQQQAGAAAGSPPAGSPPGAPPPAPQPLAPQAQAPNAMEAALADQQARQQSYSARLAEVADRNANERMGVANTVTTGALNTADLNKSAAQQAIGQLEAQLAAAAAEEAASGGGGGGGSGGGGGGGSGGSDTLTAGQAKALADSAIAPIDYRDQIGTRGGSRTLKDFIYGVKGGSKGHLSSDLSNLDEVYRRQQHDIKKNKKIKDKKGKLKRLKNAYNRASKLKGKAAENDRKRLMNEMYITSFMEE